MVGDLDRPERALTGLLTELRSGDLEFLRFGFCISVVLFTGLFAELRLSVDRFGGGKVPLVVLL